MDEKQLDRELNLCAGAWYEGFSAASNDKFMPADMDKVNPYDPEGLIE